jgi:hypothetical protein
MTLNNAHSSYRGQANIIVDEPGRFNLSMWLDPTIQKFIPMAHFNKPLWDNRRIGGDGGWRQHWQPAEMKVSDCPNVIGYRRNEHFNAARWLHEGTINWGNHKDYGGSRSVMLAALRILFILGFRRVYLLGVDFDMTPEKKYHFAEARSPASIRNNVETYAKLQRWFSELQPHFLQERFIVKNCNPRSRLTAFPFITYEEAITEATSSLGDYVNERTIGMYRRYSDKIGETGTTPAPLSPTGNVPLADQTAPAVTQKIDTPPHVTTDLRPALTRLIDPIVAAIESTKCEEEPFGHLNLEKIFPPLLYRQILSSLPSQRHYSRIPSRNKTVPDGPFLPLYLPLEQRCLEHLTDGQREFWSDIGRALRSPNLEQALRRAFESNLAFRFGKEWNKITIEPRPVLLYRTCDGGGPQHGIDARVIIAQFYLPQDFSNLHLGTALYRQSDGQFELAKRLPFRPNSGYAFPVTDRSFHGTDSLPPEGVRCESLLLTYSLPKKQR